MINEFINKQMKTERKKTRKSIERHRKERILKRQENRKEEKTKRKRKAKKRKKKKRKEKLFRIFYLIENSFFCFVFLSFSVQTCFDSSVWFCMLLF